MNMRSDNRLTAVEALSDPVLGPMLAEAGIDTPEAAGPWLLAHGRTVGTRCNPAWHGNGCEISDSPATARFLRVYRVPATEAGRSPRRNTPEKYPINSGR